jgi:hypothetical protein
VQELLYDMLAMDLDGWRPRDHVPQTKVLLDQKMLGLTGLEKWYVHLLNVGELPGASAKNPLLHYLRGFLKTLSTTPLKTNTRLLRSKLTS